jgi:hypothetical protein
MGLRCQMRQGNEVAWVYDLGGCVGAAKIDLNVWPEVEQ